MMASGAKKSRTNQPRAGRRNQKRRRVIECVSD
jgi:hypothetical protein